MFSFSSVLTAVVVPLAISAAVPAPAVADTNPGDCVMFCEQPTEQQPGPDGCVLLCQSPAVPDGRADECVMLCDQPETPFPSVSLTATGLGED